MAAKQADETTPELKTTRASAESKKLDLKQGVGKLALAGAHAVAALGLAHFAKERLSYIANNDISAIDVFPLSIIDAAYASYKTFRYANEGLRALKRDNHNREDQDALKPDINKAGLIAKGVGNGGLAMSQSLIAAGALFYFDLAQGALRRTSKVVVPHPKLTVAIAPIICATSCYAVYQSIMNARASFKKARALKNALAEEPAA